MGFLMNAEEVLLAGGFDLAEAYAYALGEYDRIEPLEQAAAGQDSASAREWRRQDQSAQEALLRRWDTALAFLQAHAPKHPLLSHYLSYRARWRLAQASAPGQTRDTVTGPDAAFQAPDMPLERLLHLHARLSALALPHEFVRSYAIFLAGLRYAISRQAVSGTLLSLPAGDELRRLSARCVEAAVDFALQAEPQKLARTVVRLPGDTAFHCLFMGIAYVQENCRELAGDWMRRGVEREKRLCLFFAMGVECLTAKCARRLVGPLQPQLPRLVSHHLGPEVGQCLEQFSAERD